MGTFFKGKRKILTISALPIVALLFWPFFIAGLLGLLAYKKIRSPGWKYGIIAVLLLFGIGSAPQYYANWSQTSTTKPHAIQTNKGAVMGVKTVNIPTLAPTNTPTPTLIPTATPTVTIAATKYTAPIKYVSPTQYLAPTATPTSTATSGLSNDNYYTNSAGEQVHSPAYSNSVPSGATALCGDGTYSFSTSRRGTCSHHGGVSQWL